MHGLRGHISCHGGCKTSETLHIKSANALKSDVSRNTTE